MIKQVPNDGASSQHKERLQQKANNAAQTFLANDALLDDGNQFLTTVNEESKARRSIKGEILGRAKVTSWKDLEKARAERAVKDATKAEKVAKKVVNEANKAAREANVLLSATLQVEENTAGKKRGRKRKSATVGTDTPERGAGDLEPRAKVARTSEAQVDDETVATPYQSPVAKMN
jgi:hypothetical protein